MQRRRTLLPVLLPQPLLRSQLPLPLRLYDRVHLRGLAGGFLRAYCDWLV